MAREAIPKHRRADVRLKEEVSEAEGRFFRGETRRLAHRAERRFSIEGVLLLE